ncbi:MAG: 30S ribosomal protein S7, partial [Candidatus Levybacteria bacterium CG_4_10_14_0_2_um_filter_35_8]
MRHKKVTKRQISTDRIHNNLMVAKFINKLMKDGKKTTAEKVLYEAF